ncbi:MAG: Gx transporter family protein [Lachnospiraceae bacterium]
MSNKVAHMGMYIAIAMIFSYVEMLIPFNFGIPGMKLGLANLIVVVVLYKMNYKDAYIVSIIRVVLVGMLFGNLASIAFSLSGCLLSLTIMCIMHKLDVLSILGVSMIGAVFHNIGQILMAMLVVSSFSVVYYLPVLLVAGIITGLVIGIIAREMLKRIK